MAASTDSHRAAERELVVTRMIDAPRAWCSRHGPQPEHVARWWGPQGFTTIGCEMDIRVGGTIPLRHALAARAPTTGKRGVYREIVEPERIVFTFAWEDADGNPGHELLTTVTFAEHGSKTQLTLHQAVFETAERPRRPRARLDELPANVSPNTWRAI